MTRSLFAPTGIDKTVTRDTTLPFLLRSSPQFGSTVTASVGHWFVWSVVSPPAYRLLLLLSKTGVFLGRWVLYHPLPQHPAWLPAPPVFGRGFWVGALRPPLRGALPTRVAPVGHCVLQPAPPMPTLLLGAVSDFPQESIRRPNILNGLNPKVRTLPSPVHLPTLTLAVRQDLTCCAGGSKTGDARSATLGSMGWMGGRGSAGRLVLS